MLDGSTEPLQEIVLIATNWLPTNPDDAGPRDYRLWLYRALAHHRLADSAGEDERELELAEADYRLALAHIETSRDRSVSVLEIQEGLAGLVQVLGRKRLEEQRAREAVRLFREVVENTQRDANSPQEGGLLYNLSGALVDLVPQVDEEEAALLRDEALRLLGRAETVFQSTGDPDRLADVQHRITELA